jgi:hypothetical protein
MSGSRGERPQAEETGEVMTVTIKTGTKDGIASSYNLFFDNGLRLKTEDLAFLSKGERDSIRQQFEAVIVLLLNGGATVEGSLNERSPKSAG